MSLTRELRAVKLARRRLNKDQKPFHVLTLQYHILKEERDDIVSRFKEGMKLT